MLSVVSLQKVGFTYVLGTEYLFDEKYPVIPKFQWFSSEA